MFYKKKIKRQKWIFCNADANANPDADANVEISTWPLLYHKSIICCKTVRTERNGNPQQIWTEGFYRLAPTNMNGLLELKDSSLYGIDDDGPIPELKTADDIQVPERDIQISVDQENYLASTFDPWANDGNIGKKTFLQVRNSLTQLLEHSQ